MVKHFSVRGVHFNDSLTGVIVTVTTDVICVPVCRRTKSKPQVHRETAIKRGLPVREDLRICFVSFTDYTPDDPAPGYTHTFTFPDWTYCNTWWVMFYAFVDGEVAVSTSPPFRHHNALLPPPVEPLDIGQAALDRNSNTGFGYIWMCLSNPADRTGHITKVATFVQASGPAGTTIRVGTMYLSGSNYVCRDLALIPDVPIGYSEHTVDIEVVTGDYLAGGWATRVELSNRGGHGVSNCSGTLTKGSTYGSWTYHPTWDISLFGEGFTIEGG